MTSNWRAVRVGDAGRRRRDGERPFAAMSEVYLVNAQQRGFLRKDVDTATTARAINAMIFESVTPAPTGHGPRAAKSVRARLGRSTPLRP